MRKILIPFDGSESALRAVQYAATQAHANPLLQLELLTVLDPVIFKSPDNLSQQELDRLYANESDRLLQPAKQALDQAGVPYQTHCRVGSPANQIAEYVHEAGCEAVIMGTRGFGPVASLVIGSVATKVIYLVDVPVTLIK